MNDLPGMVRASIAQALGEALASYLPRFLSVAQVSAISGIKESSVRKAIRLGKLRARRKPLNGRSVLLVAVDDYRRWMSDLEAVR